MRKFSHITKWNQNEVTHSYEYAGEYEVLISGKIEGWSFLWAGFEGIAQGGSQNIFREEPYQHRQSSRMIDVEYPKFNQHELKEIKSWGPLSFGNTDGQFIGCSILEISADDAPDLSSTTSLALAFAHCSEMVGNESFDLWDTSNITDMRNTFYLARKFNASINNWDTSNVESLSEIFAYAESFNQQLDMWNVSNVEDFTAVFFGAKKFNQSLMKWDLINAKVIDYLFMYSESFDQDISQWDYSNIESMNRFLFNSNLSPENYGFILTLFASQEGFGTEVNLNCGNLRYSRESENAREKLINVKKWNINDAGLEN